MKAMCGAWKWAPSRSCFVNTPETLSFPAMWRIFISLRWMHSLIWFSRRLIVFIPFFGEGFWPVQTGVVVIVTLGCIEEVNVGQVYEGVS